MVQLSVLSSILVPISTLSSPYGSSNDLTSIQTITADGNLHCDSLGLGKTSPHQNVMSSPVYSGEKKGV